MDAVAAHELYGVGPGSGIRRDVLVARARTRARAREHPHRARAHGDTVYPRMIGGPTRTRMHARTRSQTRRQQSLQPDGQ